MIHEESEETEQEPNWPAIRDLFSQIIGPARSWPEADCFGELKQMADIFSKSFPGVHYTYPEDIQLALHDLNIDPERNEHNNKFYYLAKWR